MSSVDDVAEAALPAWVKSLKALVPIASTLVTVATNPVEWLRGKFLRLLVEYAFIRPAAWILEYMIWGFNYMAGAIVSTAGPLASPFVILGDAFVAVAATVYGAVYAIADTAGFAGPIAAAFATAVMIGIVVTLIYAGWSVIPGSDALEQLGRWRP